MDTSTLYRGVRVALINRGALYRGVQVALTIIMSLINGGALYRGSTVHIPEVEVPHPFFS